LNDIFGNRDCSGRTGKWATELSEHVIDFLKRSAIKSQVLVDFIADWIEPLGYTEGTVIDTPWQVYCDGAWGISGTRVAAILMSPLGIKLRYVAQLLFKAETDKCSNNIVEYNAVLLGLCKLRPMAWNAWPNQDGMHGNTSLERYLAVV
jgi:hypothetical protein